MISRRRPQRVDASATAILECRLYFLRVAADHPEIKLGASLREKVFEPSKRYWAELGLPVPNRPYPEWTQEQLNAAEAFSLEKSRLIEKWAADHNLDYEWVHRAAMDAVGWETFPERPFALIPGYLAPEFIWTSWFFEHEREPAYRKQVNDSFQKALDAYIRRVKQQRSQFLKHRFAQSSHYSWAAEHVCLKRQFSSIARRAVLKGDSVTPQAVRQAVLPVLERIGIPSDYNLQKAKKSTS